MCGCCVCPYHFPYALPHQHCHPAWSFHSCPLGVEGHPVLALMNSYCLVFLTPPARCHSNSAVSPDVGPEADSQQKTSLYETAAREEILNVTKVQDWQWSYFKITYKLHTLRLTDNQFNITELHRSKSISLSKAMTK